MKYTVIINTFVFTFDSLFDAATFATDAKEHVINEADVCIRFKEDE